MMRSLYSGVTGLRNHQTKMDVIGNNIANVNTIGYKSSRVIFQDIYSQTIKPASTSGGATGGTNPQQIGLGVQVATIDVIIRRARRSIRATRWTCRLTATATLVISNGTEQTYTRAGNLYTDSSNNLVTRTAITSWVLTLMPAAISRQTPAAMCAKNNKHRPFL
jgi:flagellar hook protein FlgE